MNYVLPSPVSWLCILISVGLNVGSLGILDTSLWEPLPKCSSALEECRTPADNDEDRGRWSAQRHEKNGIDQKDSELSLPREKGVGREVIQGVGREECDCRSTGVELIPRY